MAHETSYQKIHSLIYFILILANIGTPLSVDIVAGICQLKSLHGSSLLASKLLSLGSNSLISLRKWHDFQVLNVDVVNEIQSGFFVIYVPQTSAQFRNILENLSREMDRDENIPSWWADGMEMHTICLPTTHLDIVEGTCSNSNVLKGLDIPLNKHVYLVKASSSRTLEFMEIYSLEGWDCLVVRNVSRMFASSNEGGNIATTELIRLSGRRDDLMGALVRVAGQEDPGYRTLFEVKQIDGRTIFTGGTQYRMSLDYQIMLNFTYEPIYGKGWPRGLIRNGTRLDGIGEQLMDKEADFIATSHAWTPTRVRKIHYLPPVTYAQSCIFYRGVAIKSYSRGILFQPFETKLWEMALVTIVVLLITVAVITFILNISGSASQQLEISIPCISTTAVVLSQGSQYGPFDRPIRLAIVTAAMTSSVLYMAYTGAFVASVSTPPTEPRTVRALKENGLTLITDPYFLVFSEDFIRDPTELEEVALYSAQVFQDEGSLVTGVLNKSTNVAAIYGLDGFFGKALSLNVSGQEFCEISVVYARRESRVPASFMVRKGWPYRELFTQKTVLLIERGLSHLYWNSYLRTIQPPCIQHWKYENAISFDECQTAFLIVLCGTCMAVAVLVGENCLK